MIWGEARRKSRKKKISEALLQEKINLERPFSKGIPAEKINPFSIFPPAPPQIINGDWSTPYLNLYRVTRTTRQNCILPMNGHHDRSVFPKGCAWETKI